MLMNDTAQIIISVAILAVAVKGVIWSFRCPKDSPHYKLPPLEIGLWRETNHKERD
jgi:hypothetical protein